MNNNDENLDLLNLDESEAPVDSLPDAEPFLTPKSRRPLILWGVLIVIMLLAVYIIVRAVTNDESSSIEVELGTEVTAEIPDGGIDGPETHVNFEPVPAQDIENQIAPSVSTQFQVANLSPTTVETVKKEISIPEQEVVGMPVRVIADRHEVKFDSSKPVIETHQSVHKHPANKVEKKRIEQRRTVKNDVSSFKKANWYVQFGSYSSRMAAESAERQLKKAHKDLFAGKQFVILGAVLPNGATTYRLRIGFVSSGEANGYCRNAKSDGLECYVAK